MSMQLLPLPAAAAAADAAKYAPGVISIAPRDKISMKGCTEKSRVD